MTRTHTTVLATCLALGAATSGCSEDVGSDAIRTQGMWAGYRAIATGDGETRVTATLRVGGDNGTFVNLVDGDELVARVDGNEGVMSPDGRNYRIRFDTDAGGTEINIDFQREDDEDAPNSTTVLPEPFTMAIEQRTVARGGNVVVTWDPAGSGDMEWEVDGDCVWNRDGVTPDDGELVLGPEDVEVKSVDEGETCQVTVTLDRVSEGSVDPAFEEGGEFPAIQRRTRAFESTPGADEPGGSEPSPDEPTGMGGSDG